MYSTSQPGPLLRLMPQDRCDVRDWELGAGNRCTFPTIHAQKEYPETRGRRGVLTCGPIQIPTLESELWQFP